VVINPPPSKVLLKPEWAAPVIQAESTNPVVRWWQTLNLSQKAITAAALIGIIPALTVGGVAYSVAHRAIQQQAEVATHPEKSELEPDALATIANRSLGLSILLTAIATAGLAAVVATL
jgi:hypothetical protein